MITATERQQIKYILQSPQWQTIERVAHLLCDKISYDSVVMETEWDTLRTAILNEGKTRGIKELIQELYREAQHE